MNEPDIVKALKQAGASVKRVSVPGLMDLIVWHPRCGVKLLEVKRPKATGQTVGRATRLQKATTVEGWPIVTVYTAIEALAAIGAVSASERTSA